MLEISESVSVFISLCFLLLLCRLVGIGGPWGGGLKCRCHAAPIDAVAANEITMRSGRPAVGRNRQAPAPESILNKPFHVPACTALPVAGPVRSRLLLRNCGPPQRDLMWL